MTPEWIGLFLPLCDIGLSAMEHINAYLLPLRERYGWDIIGCYFFKPMENSPLY
jgi:hypothetical protein